MLLPKDEELCLTDAVPDDRNCFEAVETKWTYSVIWDSQYLSSREKELVIRLILLGKRQEDVAKEMGITQAHVSRLRKKALIKLKEDYLLNYA